MPKKSICTPIAAALLALFSAPLALPVSADVLESGGIYRGTTTLESPQYGVAFTLPEEWIGTLPPGSALFLMRNKGAEVEAYIYAGIEKMTGEQVQEMMRDDLDVGDVTFHPRGDLRVEGATVSGTYSVTGTEKEMSGWVTSVVGEHGWVITFLGQSTPEHAEILRRGMAAVGHSVQFTEPGNPPGSAGDQP